MSEFTFNPSGSKSVLVEPMKWPGFQPICHAFGCQNAANWHVLFPYFEEYRCDDHKPERVA